MKELRNELKKKIFQRAYLFFGEENYLIKLYEHELIAAVFDSDGADMMNMDIFEGKVIDVEKIINAANTLPFMSSYRLIIYRDSMLFAPGRKDESEKIAKFLNEIPETTILAFIESDVDRRSKLYKTLNDFGRGRTVDFKPPTERELVDWVCRTFKKAGYEISLPCAVHLLKTVPDSMDSIMSEVEKLVSYKVGTGIIMECDVDRVCTKSLETKIFDLVDAVGSRKPEKSLEIFSNLMLMKESPIMVISMIARQFRLLLQCRYLLDRGMHEAEIAKEIGHRSFVIKGIIKQSVNFTQEQLLGAFKDCLEADISIKTGKINDRLAVELLIMKYSRK